MFAFALDADRTSLPAAAPGLFWAAVLLAALLAIGRSFAVEEANGARDGLRLSGLDGGAIFVGKAARDRGRAVPARSRARRGGDRALRRHRCSGVLVLVCAAVAATVGLAATGTVYGVLATGLRARDTLVPLLVLPAVTPVMLGGSRAFAAALDGSSSDAWPWVQLLVAFSVLGRGRRHDGVRSAPGGDRERRPAGTGSARPWSSRSRITAVFALWISPPDAEQGDVVRLLYLHVPTIWIAFLGFFVTAVASVLWLVPRTRRTEWDLLAGASAEVGVVFTGHHARSSARSGAARRGARTGCGTRGSPAPRSSSSCTSATSRCGAPAPTADERGKRCAIAALIAFADVPIVHLSVTWWQTLHQSGTVFNPNNRRADPRVDGLHARVGGRARSRSSTSIS